VEGCRELNSRQDAVLCNLRRFGHSSLATSERAA
jgi:hypothetical protein